MLLSDITKLLVVHHSTENFIVAFHALDKLTIENGTDRMALYSSLDITLDQQGLAHARGLPVILQAAVQRLGGGKELRTAIQVAAKPKRVANPFEWTGSHAPHHDSRPRAPASPPWHGAA